MPHDDVLNGPTTSRAAERGESLWPNRVAALPLSEVFGPTLQGEGPHAGRAVQFVRLGGCNLSCSWCDTPYTWDTRRYRLRDEIPITPVADILAQVVPDLPVVVSGGEPLIHQDSPSWADLVVGLLATAGEIHLETNGTIAPNQITQAHVTHYSVSPKLANAGLHKNGQNPALSYGWLPLLQSRLPLPSACLKVVVADAADVGAAVAMADDWGVPRSKVWVMPLGTDTTTLVKRWPVIAGAAAAAGINATQRLHVLAWGDRKGT